MTMAYDSCRDWFHNTEVKVARTFHNTLQLGRSWELEFCLGLAVGNGSTMLCTWIFALERALQFLWGPAESDE